MFSTPVAPVRGRRRPSRTPHGASATPSHQTTPTPVSPPNLPAHGEAGDGMDVDAVSPLVVGEARETREGRREGQERVLLKDDDYEVAVVAELPAELREIISELNLQAEPVQGALDDRTGYAFLTLFDRCIVWKYQDLRTRAHIPSSTSQPLYIFPIPPSHSGRPAQAALVPHQAREPGLLLVLPEGEARYWDSVTRALTSTDKYASVSLSLAEGEEVNGLWRWEGAVYLFSTTAGSICRLMLTSTNAGRALVVSSPFARPRSGLSRLFTRAQVPGSPEVVGLAVGHESPRAADVWVAKGKTLELWRVDREGGEHLALEGNMQDLLPPALPEPEDKSWWDVQLLDVAVQKNGAPVIVFACTLTTPGFVWNSSKPPTYAVATLVDSGGGEMQVGSVRELQYSTTDIMPHSHVSLVIPQGGTALFVHLPNTVISFSLLPNSPFYEDVPLRDTAENRYLGHSTDPAEEGHVTCLTAMSGLVALTVNVSSVAAKAESMQHEVNREQLATERLKEHIEHAVYYGGSSANPLSFDLRTTQVQGDLAGAIEQISREIVSSSYRHKPLVQDMAKQLQDRLDAAHQLIAFIDSNHLLNRLSMATRWGICTDAEKIAAAQKLWTLHEEALRDESTSMLAVVLSQAVAGTMASLGEADADNSIRPFFQNEIASIGYLTHEIRQVVEQERQSAGPFRRAKVTLECDRVVVTLLTAAQEYRSEHSIRYGISESSIPVPVWTETKENIDILLLLNRRTMEDCHAVHQFNLDNPPSESSREEIESLQEGLKYHLLYVAQAYFGVVRNCLTYLAQVHGDDSSSYRNLYSQHLADRKGIIMSLVSMGHLQAALRLAELEEDWETLVDLCTDDRLGTTSALLEEYILNHGEPFAFALYQRYYETGQLYELLHRNAREEIQLLDRFLQQNQYYRISWIHDISMGNFQLASHSLLTESASTPKSIDRKTMLSLGKLSELAQCTTSQYKQNGTKIIGPYDKGLEMVTVHDKLIEEFQEGIALGALADPEVRAATITDMKASRLEGSVFADVFKAAVKHVMNHEILPVEDLVDVLTLKDNGRSEFKDYATALRAIERCEHELPRARAQITLEALWRRVYLHNTWSELQPSDDMSDVERLRRLRGTAAYSTMNATINSIDPKFFLRPSHCYHLPTVDELRGRFEDYTPEQIAAIQQALGKEIKELKAAFMVGTLPSSEQGLDFLYDEMFALLRSDVQR